DGVGEQSRRQLVATRRQCHVELPPRSTVELRRAAGPRSAPSGQSPERGFEQPLLGEAVEVEARDAARNPRRGRRLVAADLAAGRRHVTEERAPHRITQECEAAELLAELV